MSLTLAEARARAALISDVSYDIELDLTDRETFGCRTTVRFTCATPGAATFLELARGLDVTVDGAPAQYADDRIALTDLAERNEVVVEARIPYVTDGDGMHTFTDPADGETYVSAYCGMDIARFVFPCFDQPDLKAPLALSVVADPGWTVVANGRAVERDGGRWRFTTTPPVSTYLFVVCAGPWHSVSWEHPGPDGRPLPFGWHARRSLAAELDRDAAELKDLTERYFDHYATLFDEPYPFDSYDQAFVPGQNWGALETPGCVTYRDEYLPVGRVTEGDRRRRAIVIAHEMAHMWFGNLVTMRWWEDSWLNESFADYMGFRVAQDAGGLEGTFVDFAVGRKAGAYVADECRSTHPVAAVTEDVVDVDTAFNNFDSISYAKGNSVLRQLVTWLGDEPFLAGVNAHLTRHRFGNATLDDFVDALDGASDRDVRGWVDAWLRTTGFDTLRVVRDADGPVLHRDGSRPHRVRVSSYDDSLAPFGTGFVDVAAEPVRLGNAAVLVPNAGGETFARVRFDEESWEALARDLASLTDDGARAVVWQAACDMVRCGELAPQDFLGLVTRHVPRESHVGILESVLTWTLDVLVPQFVPAGEVTDALAFVAGACETGLESGPAEEPAVALTRALAASTADPSLLRHWLATGHTHTGLDVDPRLRWAALRRLASLGDLSRDEIEQEREADGTVLGELGAATAAAALPDAGAKADAWARMYDDPQVSNRMYVALATGFWDPEQAALVAPYVGRYLAESPGVARARGQAFSQVVGRSFPAVPLTEDDLEAADKALAGDVPTVLRRHWEDQLDELRRPQRR
ncbi:aminopeptidase N [Nocardioides sp. GCM10027113]|uniref:aminopeptidase N n=1 Tax=unclassified Nocardioides TaxID=2615069 RepID=UPI0036106113